MSVVNGSTPARKMDTRTAVAAMLHAAIINKMPLWGPEVPDIVHAERAERIARGAVRQADALLKELSR